MCFMVFSERIINTDCPDFKPLGVPGFTPSAEVIENEIEQRNYWKQGRRCSSGKVLASRSEGFQVQNPIPPKYVGLMQAKSCVFQTFPRWSDAEVWRGRRSNAMCRPLQGPSQNSPRVVLKRDIDITELNLERRMKAHCTTRFQNHGVEGRDSCLYGMPLLKN
ncbi:hypothetical protein AVEN_53838-1 [Araneus ventricosus]|uniref:Uncharacterized protein n=1 Tax=Araneus ventricosus TaxID=182803 RepID=A0A4Y2F1L7_ARAVE|nr:hypothetical protein AVEN_53838-1 [Araneus ventricosus]